MPSDLAERVAQACKAHWEDVDMTYWCCPFAATSCGVTVTIDAADPTIVRCAEHGCNLIRVPEKVNR